MEWCSQLLRNESSISTERWMALSLNNVTDHPPKIYFNSLDVTNYFRIIIKRVFLLRLQWRYKSKMIITVKGSFWRKKESYRIENKVSKNYIFYSSSRYSFIKLCFCVLFIYLFIALVFGVVLFLFFLCDNVNIYSLNIDFRNISGYL